MFTALNTMQRKAFQKAENKVKKDSTNLENSILLSIKKQAKKKGYKIEKEEISLMSIIGCKFFHWYISVTLSPINWR